MDEEYEVVQEDEPESDIALPYLGQIELPELRRYVALDMARMLGSLPDKAPDLAAKIDRFLQGKTLRDVKDQ